MPIEVDMMLADAVTMYGGLISLLGAGWQVRAADGAGPSGIAIVVRVPRKQAGMHRLRLELLDSDNELVVIPPPDGPGEMVIEAAMLISGLKDPKLKTPLLGTFGIPVPPFPLAPGREYWWRLHVDGKTRAGWTLPFRTMSEDEAASSHPILLAADPPAEPA